MPVVGDVTDCLVSAGVEASVSDEAAVELSEIPEVPCGPGLSDVGCAFS